MKSVKKFFSCVSRSLTLASFFAGLPACVAFGSTAGEGEYAMVVDGGDRSGTEADDDCGEVPWGNSCQEEGQIYDVTFNGIDLSTQTEGEISLSDIYCDGFAAVVLFAGDIDCPSCPFWLEELGNMADDIHARDAALVISYTDGFGAYDLAHSEALSVVEDADPDYVTGSKPYHYPCRYYFTPFLMVVDLDTATILYRQDDGDGFPDDLLDMLEAAR